MLTLYHVKSSVSLFDPLSKKQALALEGTADGGSASFFNPEEYEEVPCSTSVVVVVAVILWQCDDGERTRA